MFRLTWGVPVVLVVLGFLAMVSGTPVAFTWGLIGLGVVLAVVWYYAIFRRTGNRDFL